jgi:hypothetical protein
MSSSSAREAFEFREKESAFSKFWRYCSYAWTIGKNAFVIWLVHLAFGRMESVFQKLVIEEAYLHRKLLLRLQKAFDRNSVGSDEQELDKVIKDFHKADFVYSLNLIGTGIVYLYAIWKVFDTLVLS